MYPLISFIDSFSQYHAVSRVISKNSLFPCKSIVYHLRPRIIESGQQRTNYIYSDSNRSMYVTVSSSQRFIQILLLLPDIQ